MTAAPPRQYRYTDLQWTGITTYLPHAVRHTPPKYAHEVADVDVPGFWVECKRGAQPNVRAALRQAKEAREASGRALTHHAVAIVRDDRQDAVVAMPLGDFLKLVREWWERGQR
jgi:hypothetical protein